MQMTVTEAAMVTGLHRQTLWRYRATGLLPSSRRGRSVIVNINQVRDVHQRRLANNPAHQYRLRRAQAEGMILI